MIASDTSAAVVNARFADASEGHTEIQEDQPGKNGSGCFSGIAVDRRAYCFEATWSAVGLDTYEIHVLEAAVLDLLELTNESSFDVFVIG